MASKYPGQEQSSLYQNGALLPATRMQDRESILAALALLFGPDTDYHLRVRATRRLSRLGPDVLPLLLNMLSDHPEITSPPWPWWPPQYEHFSRLLIQIGQRAQLSPEALLQHPAVSQPPGPVLWTSVIEAANLLPQADHEPLLDEGLTAPWMTVRYAAAMALANLAGKGPLLESTLEDLRAHTREEEAIPVQLATSYALLRQGDSGGIGPLSRLLHFGASEEARKAAAFVLAACFQSREPCQVLSPAQREQLTRLLIASLSDVNEEVAMHAACALGNIAQPSALPSLDALLALPGSGVQTAALAALEGMANRDEIRRVIWHNTVPGRVVTLLRSEDAHVRRQACYTLAALGGEYGTAVLGATLLNNNHPGHIEAIEGLRLLRGALRAPTRTSIIRWLLQALRQPREEVQVTVLDSLSSLLWQAHTRNQRKALHEITAEIMLDETFDQLLSSPSAWVRQRTVELLGMLDGQLSTPHTQLIRLLHNDVDSGVRACIAYHLGLSGARWAIPSLLQALLDPDENVAETALHALGSLACPDDTIVVYVMKELAGHNRSSEDGLHYLAQPARDLLKKWQRALRPRR